MIIFYNGNIVTLDESNPLASALIVENERIAAVGDSEQLLQQIPAACKRINLENCTVLPGITDSHIHVLQYAQSLSRINCETSSKQECLLKVREKVKNSEPGTWILGHGWNQNLWSDGYGSRSDLDEISEAHPIYLTSKSLHAAWANSYALQTTGITSATPDPAGGIIQRDEHGVPTGILLDNAIPLLEMHIPPLSDHEARTFLSDVQNELLRYGITCVHDFDKENSLRAFQTLDLDRKLKLRVIKSIPLEYLDHAISEGLRTGDRGSMLEIGSLKLFADGALGSRTAALFEPYETEPKNTGLLIKAQNELFEIGSKAIENGFSLAVHAIGDRAVHEVLLACRKLFTALPGAKSLPHKHRIEHVQMIRPGDLDCFNQLDLVASMQPSHAPSDREMAVRYWGKRTAFSYPLRSVHQSGALCIYGSDAPVESPNPFGGIASAVCRQDSHGSDPFHAEQAIRLDQALEGYCVNPHIATGKGQELGRLKAGFLADFIVIQANPFAIEPIDLYNIVVNKVYISGSNVYER